MSTAVLLGMFAAAAVVTWIAGVVLSNATDAIDTRFKLGDAFGGMVLLAIAGSLPELAITISAAATGNLGLAAGNLVGGIAVQTCVLVICDAAAGKQRPLSYLVGSLIPVLEGVLVIAVSSVVLLGALLPKTAVIWHVSPASVAVVIVWVAGLYILERVRRKPEWKVEMAGGVPGRANRRIEHKKAPRPFGNRGNGAVILIFALASVVTLIAGVALEVSGNQIATNLGINGVVFGATFLALATALPEISTGIQAVRLGDNQLAMGDIFGGNAFQLCLFLVADAISGKPLMPTLGAQNAWLGALGVLLTTVYVGAVVARPKRCYVRLGIDSVVVAVIYAVGIAGLMHVPGS